MTTTTTEAWQQQQPQQPRRLHPLPKTSTVAIMSRRNLLQRSIFTATATGSVLMVWSKPSLSRAIATESISPSTTNNKLLNLSNEQLLERIRSDVMDHQFLVTGRLSRNLYDERATFQDEIDTYGLDQWMEGTQKLFVASKSHVELEPNTLVMTNNDTVVEFRFQESLCFNIPLLLPTVYLSGKVTLQRDETTGLITSYREQWDQDVPTVLKSAKFFS